MARAHADRLPPWERMKFIQQRGQTCQYCGATGDLWACNGRPWQVDHVIPVAFGGAVRDWENLALACFPCNMLKGDALLDALPDRLAAIRAGSTNWVDHIPAMLARQDAWPA